VKSPESQTHNAVGITKVAGIKQADRYLHQFKSLYLFWVIA
jgi:hypothetical protein